MRLKELRADANMTQQKLAKLIGVSRSTVAMWESNSSQPDNETLGAIASIFDVSVDYLLALTDTKKAPASKEASTALDNEIMQLMAQLDEANREKAIDHLQYLIARQEGDAKKK